MKKILLPVFDFLLFSNLFMSLCAVAQALVTFYLINAQPLYTVTCLLFTATLGVYNFSIIIGKPKHPELSPYRRVRWFFGHYRLMVAFTGIALVSLIPLFFMVSAMSRLLLLLLAVLSFCYSLPLFTTGGKRSGLRDIPGFKPLLITLVWTLSCVLLPVLEAQHVQNSVVPLRDVIILTAKRFLLIGALTIPFDIRDLFDDRQAGLKTIPVAWGEKNAYLFCQLLLTGYVVLLFTFRNNGFNNDFFALSVTAALMGWLIFRSKWKKNEYYYFFYMDGILMLQYAVLMIFRLIFK